MVRCFGVVGVTLFALAYSSGALLANQDTSDPPSPDELPQVVYLHTEFLPYEHTVEKGITLRLMREMARQAFLIATRDELGVATRDGTLRETPPDGAEVIHLALLERADLKGQWQVKLFAFDKDDQEHETRGLWTSTPLWEKTYSYTAAGSKIYANASPTFGSASREEFVEALRGAGVKQAIQTSEPARPIETETWNNAILQVDFVAQYGVVRAVHEAIREQGESPELLGLLVRAYANLSMLTQHQWNAVSEVFAARAMMYADRLAAASGQCELAIWNRAYVWALIGSHNHALADLEAMEATMLEKNGGAEENELDETDAGDFDLPEWTRLIQPFLQCDRDALHQVAAENESLKPWALRLSFQITSAYRYPQWMHQAGAEMIQNVPTAYGVYAELTHHGGSLGTTRMGAYYGPAALGRFAPASLDAVPDMPKEIRALLPTDAIKAGIVQAMIPDPNPHDPFSPVPSFVAGKLRDVSRKETTGGLSWSALAYLLEEETFLKGAHFLTNALNATKSSHEEEVDGILPLVKDHRYAGYIDSFRHNQRQEWDRFAKSVKDLVIDDPRANMSMMTHHLKGIKNDNGIDVGRVAWSNASRNFTMQGLLEKTFVYGPEWKSGSTNHAKIVAREFRNIVPHCEVGLRMTIQSSPKAQVGKVEEWENELQEDPAAFQLLGGHYIRLNETDSAIRCYQKSLELLPTLNSTYALAYIYWKQDDFDQWEQTLLKFLESENHGLEHAQAQQRLAYGLIGRGQWRKAKPHAEAAGQTWSAWGLGAASRVTEGLAEWEESENWVRESCQSYPTYDGYSWYYWCQRNGRGDVESARQLAQVYFATPTPQPTVISEIIRGGFHLLEGDRQTALDDYRRALAFNPSYTCTFMVVQLSREQGDEQTAAEAIAALEKHFESLGDKRAAVDEVGWEILEVLKSEKITDEKLEQIDQHLQLINSNTRCSFAYFLARQLAAMDRDEEADEYWRKALVIPSFDPLYATLSGAELVERLGAARRDDDELDESDLWPPLEKASAE